MRARAWLTAAALALGIVATASPVRAEDPTAPVQVFEPAPQSTPVYGTKPPHAAPEVQQTYITAHDGVRLFVETWLPDEHNGVVPPARVPTILIMTPYVVEGQKRYAGAQDVIAYFTSRGYAVAQAHVRGTGESGGCLEQTSAAQIDDGARVVEYLGRDAPWSDANVGMFGHSYDGETQISTAGLGDPEKIRYLKAIVPSASVAGQYEYSFFDGVPYAAQALLSNTSYLTRSFSPGARASVEQYAQKSACQPEVLVNSANVTGDSSDYWVSREYRAGADRIRAATLHVHGLADFNVAPIGVSGFFDRLPKRTPRKGLFGLWAHSLPSSSTTVPVERVRSDFLPMVLAWYDRWLKGLDTGVEDWPDVQVQASDGSWRAETDFPGRRGGGIGQLALSEDGLLGATEPAGASSFLEGLGVYTSNVSETRAVFRTPALPRPLHLTGQPILDLWVSTDRPDGHVAAQLTILGADGRPLRHTRSGQLHATYGFRSLQHREPIAHNWFRQRTGSLAPLNQPFQVQVRFHPTDLVVPKGGRLELTLAGASTSPRIGLPSGTGARLTALHSCATPSTLRFLLADPEAPALEVRENADGSGPLIAGEPEVREVDGAGLATARVCGQKPVRLDAFTPTRDLLESPSGPTRAS